MPDPAVSDAEKFRQRAIRLEYLTVAWMAIEAAVGLLAGNVASSIALVGFGLDSVMELVAALTLLWRFQQRGPEEIDAEARAVKVVGLTFFALAAYVGYESASDLWFHRAPKFSVVGTALAAAALVVMPLLGLAKRRVAWALNSRALASESTESLFCAYLSATLLLGMGLNGLLGWSWADPAAALVMAALMVREGVEAFRGDRTCRLQKTGRSQVQPN